MEELKNEQAAVAAQTAEAEEISEGRDEQTSTSLKKFKDVKSLEKAYGSLESEFTKRSQRIKELEGKVAELTEFKLGAEKEKAALEAEKKAREYAWQYGKKHGKGWKRSKKAVDGAACEMQLMYVEQTRQADYLVWFYQAGNEEDGIAVEMTPQGELIAADEGFG